MQPKIIRVRISSLLMSILLPFFTLRTGLEAQEEDVNKLIRQDERREEVQVEARSEMGRMRRADTGRGNKSGSKEAS